LPADPQPAPAIVQPSDNDILRGTTVNILFDGYYGYNFNNPIGRVNLLRAFDVSSNAFSLNQADIVLENAPDPDHGKRYGLRLDLQFGQATETLQGNAANEPRPNIYRNIFQAYGTYVAPVGNGLTIDFGKWASSLGIENNYVQDQMNYSRSYWFDFLPFYHMGVRVNYKVSNLLSLSYWITNGTDQTEPFNGFKDELFGLNLQPHKNLNWTINYYLGQEHPDFEFLPNATGTNLPTLQGIPFAPILHPAMGKLHILDSYVTWTATPKLTFAAEGDYVIERLYTNSAPSIVDGGALYARYQVHPRVYVAARSEYLSDRGGLYTGVTQALKEVTLTLEQKVGPGFLLFEEWRTDFSNQRYFLTNMLGVLRKQQSTATMGVVWWFGAKKSPW
jgi:Putative beta-barrel porin-2, OmpL-like. bbp2